MCCEFFLLPKETEQFHRRIDTLDDWINIKCLLGWIAVYINGLAVCMLCSVFTIHSSDYDADVQYIIY